MIEKFREKLDSRVKEGDLLARHTNFRIGGPAKYFFEARTSDELVAAVGAARELGVPFFVLGGGSNVLVSDSGFEGLVVKAANRTIKLPVSSVRCQVSSVFVEAGALSALVARKTAEAGLTGFEWAISLPGTVGGAVRGNAGCFGGEMKDIVKMIEMFDVKKSVKCQVSSVKCQFAYRDSIFKHANLPPVVLSATLELKSDDPKACLARVEEKLRARREKQPFESSSAGCIFKNVEFQDESEITKLRERIKIPQEFIDAKRIPAGWIIEQLGLKGRRIGDAQISEKHGNFVLNLGKATADEVVQLIALIKTRARNEFGIQLQEEVQYVGF